MSTTAQINANQQNARHSTGPRTAEGKTAASLNSSKHGLTASDDTLARQNREEIERLTANYRQQYPSNAPTAQHLRHLLACASIRQSKLENKELQLLETVEIDDPILACVERYRAAAERSFYRALKELQAIQRNEANLTTAVQTKPLTPPSSRANAPSSLPIPGALNRVQTSLPFRS